MKRLLTVLLAGLLAAGAVTGCSQEPGASSAAAPSADGSSSAAETSSAAGEADTSEQVNLVYYYWGTPQNDLASVNEALNEYLLEKMNTTVELKLIDGGTYDSKMALVMSGNEEYDLCFTSSWANNYYTNVANGAYVDMGPLLDAYAPVTKETAPQRFWDAITVNGRIYGAFNFQQSAAGFGFRVQAPLADKCEFDWQNAKQLSDIEPFLEDVKANEPNLIPLGYNRTVDPFVKGPIAWGYDAIGDIFSPGWVALDDESLTVVNQYDTDAFREYTALTRSWYEKGYLRADRNAVSQISYGKEYMDMVAEDLGRMLYTNNYIVSAVTGSAYDPIVSTQAINTMQMLVLSNDGIDSIYYYNRKLGRVASSRTGEFSPIGEFYDGGSREPRAPQPPVPQERAAPARPDGRSPAVGGERRAAARRPRDSLL